MAFPRGIANGHTFFVTFIVGHYQLSRESVAPLRQRQGRHMGLRGTQRSYSYVVVC